jgi:hypothetical protein
VGTLTWDTLESLCHRLFPAELDEHCRPDLFHNHDEQACATEKIVPAVDTLVHLSHLDASTDVLISSFYQATLAGFWSRGFSRDAREQPLRRSVPIAQEERSVLAEVDSNRSRSGRPPEPPECQRATRSQSTVTLQTMARRAGALPGDAGVPASLKAEDRAGRVGFPLFPLEAASGARIHFSIDRADKPVLGTKINWMKAVIIESDLVLTVSPHYVNELTSGPDKGV